MVVWIIGLSGSGKTTLGAEMFKILKKSDAKWVFLDGDAVRTVLGEDLGHTVEDRRKNANRITNLCKLLDSQGINVLACVLSIFHDNQKSNRSMFSSYKEIFIDVDFEKLIKRDNKNLYLRASIGEMKNVVGVDIPFPKPVNPDIVIDNNMENADFNKLAYDTIEKLGITIINEYEYSNINGLIHPQKYQYTTFEGERFFEKYLKSRNDAIEMLKIDISKLTNAYYKSYDDSFQFFDLRNIVLLCKNELNTNVDSYQDKDDVITDRYLLSLLTKLARAEIVDSTKIIADLLSLVKRFEVSKKLYSRYKIGTFSKASGDYDPIINYLLLSNILAEAHNIAEDPYTPYILFNTLLKLNDLIISTSYKVVTLSEKLLMYNALNSELMIYTALKEAHL